MSRRALVVLFALAWPGGASAQEGALSAADVVSTVRAKNPTVQAALHRLESTRENVLRLDARYVPVVVLDGNASDITTPALFGTGVSENRLRRAEVGAEAKKHLLWGTDLSLRVSGNVQENELRRPGLSGAASGGAIPMTGSLPVGLAAPTGRFGPGYGWLAKLTLKQPLLRGRGRDVAEAELNAARESQGVAERARQRVVSETLRDALIAYWELWYAHSALGIQRSARELATRQLNDANARVASGSLAPVEVLAFETELAAREEDVVRAEAEEQRARLELARLLGAEQSPALTPSADRPANASAPVLAVAEQRALAQSAELQESAANLKLNEVEARTASDALRQRLDLDAYAQVQGLTNRSDSATQLLTGSRTGTVYGGFVGLTYEIPTSRTGERAASARARADVHEAEAQLLAVRQRVLSDVRKSLEQHAAQERGVALAERTHEIAGRQLKAEEARFASGAGTPLQVIQAEDKRRSAELRVARAQADLAQTVLRIDHLTGELVARVAR